MNEVRCYGYSKHRKVALETRGSQGIQEKLVVVSKAFQSERLNTSKVDVKVGQSMSVRSWYLICLEYSIQSSEISLPCTNCAYPA